MIKTYLDANVLIAAFRSDHPASAAAMNVIGDPGRLFVASQYLRLETLRKPMFYTRKEEIEFMDAYFDCVSLWVPATDALTMKALDLAALLDLGTMDAIHAAAAIQGATQELVTMEKSSKPICRIPGLTVVSLYSRAASLS